jgi:hypothetical protein
LVDWATIQNSEDAPAFAAALSGARSFESTARRSISLRAFEAFEPDRG